MYFGVAPVIGTVSLYSHLDESKVLLMKDNYKYFVTSLDVFRSLYYELDETRAALREDCIEYAIYHRHRPLYDYPHWYEDAVIDGFIYQESGYDDYIFYNENGDVVMEDGMVVLRNKLGHLNLMHYRDFSKYYETIGGIEDGV